MATRPRALAGPGLHLLYALSGSTALLYEIVWTRLLSLELGHTTASASAVLAAFMGGLAIGAVAAGRWTGRLTPAAALRAYAGLEVAIAALALLIPFEIAAIHPLLAYAYGEGPGGAAFHALRFSSAILIVGVPAILMGATYPLVIVEGRAAGSLYAVNTAGAALGALATGFVLLPSLGIFRSTLIGVGGNVLVALLARHLSRRTAPVPIARGQSALRRRSTHETVAVPLSLALSVPFIATAVAGYAALSLEIAWTRTLAMVIGPTTYAFTTSVACFIVGLAVGSGLAAWWTRARGGRLHPEGALALALSAAAVAIGWAVGRVDDFVLAVAYRTADPGVTYTRLLVSEFVAAARLMMPMALCSGAAFPLAMVAARASSGREAGWVYAANTVGAIAGALVTAVVTIPVFGLRGTFLFATALLGTMSVMLALRHVRTMPKTLIAGVLVLVVAAVASSTSRWNVDLLASGAYKYAAYVGQEDLESRLTAGTLRYYREGATGTVAVRDLAGVRALSIDGKVDASNGGDMLTQRLLAHLPLLVRPGARRVGIVGLGSGVTLGSVLTYPVTRVDVIELSPEVVEASNWFAEENGHALQDRRVRLIRGDAGTHFRLASDRYDVLISEPSNPWMAGVAALFTREFFETLRSRLAPGGVVCQWTHTYDISADDLKSIVATFSAVFPRTRLFLVGGGDLLLVGAERALPPRFPNESIPLEARRDLVAAGITSPAVLEQFEIGDSHVARRWAGTPPLQSNDRMALEFSVPLATVGPTRDDNASALLALAAPPPTLDPFVLRDAGLASLRAQAPDRAWHFLERAAAHLANDRPTLNALVRAAAMSPTSGRLAAAESRLRAIIQSRPDTTAARLELARMLASQGDHQRARQLASEAAQVAPADPEAHEELAAIAADSGDLRGLDEAVGRLRILRANGAKTAYFDGVLHVLGGRAAEAVPLARLAVASDPNDAAAWNLLGSALGASAAPVDEIRNAFARAVHADPSDPAAYANLGTLEFSAGRAAVAANWFAQALTVDPTNETARRGLAAARAAAIP